MEQLFAKMDDRELDEYAQSASAVRDWWVVLGQRNTPAFGPVGELWEQARAELERRGITPHWMG